MSFGEIWQYGCFKDLLNSGIGYVVLFHVICGLFSYLLGSINCGILLSRIYGKDIRESGSGNAGATNMTRTYGKKAGVLTFLGDFLKASIALIVSRILMGAVGAYVAGIFCILGHAYPIYFKFKGGKGVVCIAAMALFTNWIVFLIMLPIFAIILFGFKMVSFASIMSMLIYPFLLSHIDGLGIRIIYAFVAAALVVFLHRKNIVRIFNHTESKISLGKKKKAKEANDEECEK